ncbi:MAG: SIR2 family protein [Verrucomicrobia bacterium]|nr:SIR2 family protein [Verrucomicrobiota bacterium]
MKSPAEEIENRSRRGWEMLEKGLECQTAVLLAGAGCSIGAGYPTWGGLISELANDIEPGFIPRASGQLDKLQEISDFCLKKYKSLDAVSRFINRRFKPRNPAYNNFHRSLMNLPFAGLTTTNYDHVLEDSLRSLLAPEQLSCVPVNLCDESKRLLVLDFFRDLGAKSRDLHRILHLHGSYDLPDQVMLTVNDYSRFYDGFIVDGAGKRQQVDETLTYHRKTIWALLATRMVVFVGFSLTDDVFNSVIDVLLHDVNRINERLHVAFMGIRSVDDMLRQEERFELLAVAPIYYELGTGPGDPHAKLYQLVEELEAKYHIWKPRSTVRAISARNEEMYP